jgi:hypothetical protein
MPAYFYEMGAETVLLGRIGRQGCAPLCTLIYDMYTTFSDS